MQPFQITWSKAAEIRKNCATGKLGSWMSISQMAAKRKRLGWIRPALSWEWLKICRKKTWIFNHLDNFYPKKIMFDNNLDTNMIRNTSKDWNPNRWVHKGTPFFGAMMCHGCHGRSSPMRRVVKWWVSWPCCSGHHELPRWRRSRCPMGFLSVENRNPRNPCRISQEKRGQKSGGWSKWLSLWDSNRHKMGDNCLTPTTMVL